MSEAINNGENRRIPKVVQPHGGALNSVGTPGHRPGRGRPKNEIRERMRIGLDAALELVERELAHPENLSVSEMLKIADFLAKYGIGSRFEVGQDEMPIKMYALTPEEEALI